MNYGICFLGNGVYTLSGVDNVFLMSSRRESVDISSERDVLICAV